MIFEADEIPERDEAVAKMHRHPSILAKLPYFEYSHLKEGILRNTSKRFHDLAYDLVLDGALQGEQLTLGLQHLMEAKDAVVRSGLNAAAEEARARSNV